MDVAGVKIVCGDGGCKMVRGSMVLMRRVQYGTLYKILGKSIIYECNSSVVLEEGVKDDRTLTASRETQFDGIKDWGILEKRGFNHYRVKVWFKV